MSFDYNSIRGRKHGSGTQWAAYSDLFMVLAFIFLLLYMVSSLRAGMESITTYAAVEDVKQELKLYQSIKEKYLMEDASMEEKLGYQEVLDQISLLEGEARENKNRLSREYDEQKNRESSLNQYQKMIKSLMNANAIAKAEAAKQMISAQQQNENLVRDIEYKKSDLASLESRLKTEEEELSNLSSAHYEETKKLEEKFKDLKSKHDEGQDSIASLEDMLKMEAAEKSALGEAHSEETKSLERKFEDLKDRHDDGQDRLASLENRLRNDAEKMDALKSAHSREKRDLKDRLRQMASRHDDSQENLASLEKKLKQESAEMDALNDLYANKTENLEGTIKALTQRHNASKRNLASLEDKIQAETAEKSDLRRAYSDKTKKLEREIEALRNKEGNSQGKLEQLERELARNDAERDNMKDAYDDVTKAMNDKLKRLKDNHAKTQGKLAALNDENRDKVARLSSDLDDAKKNLQNTSDDLNKTQKDLEKKSNDLSKALKMEKRRKDIARRIKDNFRDNGISAQVNSKTGDVILDFGDNYFDTDSHQLKPGMRSIVRKAIPVYAQSLFGVEMVASVISSVEIIGFASPTYAGKPVDPTGLSAANRAAVNYNLDLSYKRARSIFEYVFDTEKIKFKYQDTMVHLINVTGRSFFAEESPGDTGGLSIDEFCGQYNCMKSQRVIIKFGLSEKGAV